MNSTRLAALTFLLVAWLATAALPDLFSPTRGVDIVVFVAASAFYALLALAVLRRWRWAFWVMMLLGLVSGLEIPDQFRRLSVLAQLVELAGVDFFLRSLLRAIVPVVGLVVAVLMLVGYRKAGVWGAFI